MKRQFSCDMTRPGPCMHAEQPMFKRILQFTLTLVAVQLIAYASLAQTITYPTTAGELTRGLNSSLLTVNVGFTSACTGINVEVPLPTGVSYVSGSVAAISGTLTISDNGGSKSRPKFAVSNASVGSSITFTIARIADCGAGASGKDSVYVTSSCGTVSELGTAVNTYNILAPSLSITPPPAIANANVGGSYSRTFSVTNGGNGCLDTLRLGIKRPSGSISSPVLKIGATVIPVSSTNADSTFYKIYAGDLPGGDNLMCNGETVTFTEEFTLLNCAGLTTTYLASWGRPGNICQTTSATGIVTMSSGVPNLTAVLSGTPITNCGAVPRTITLTITNTGTAPASNVNVTFGRGNASFLPNAWAPYLDTASIQVTTPSLAPFHPAALNVGGRVVIADAGTPLCAAGKVGMVDFTMPSGFVLLPGQSMTVEYDIMACSGEECGDGMNGGLMTSALTYKNQCETNNYTLPMGTATIPAMSNSGVVSIVSQSPAQVASGSCFNVKVDAQITRDNVPATPFGYVEYTVDVPAGFSLNTASELSGIPAHAGYPKMIGGKAVFRHGIPFASNGQSLHSVTFNLCTAPGTCGPQVLVTEVKLSRDSTCVTPLVSKKCNSAPVDVYCGVPCLTGGVVPTTWAYYRTTLGLPDNDNNGIADPNGSVDLAKVDRDRYRPGDILHSEYRSYILNQTSPATIDNWNYVYSDWSFSSGKFAPSGTATVTIKRGPTTYSLTGVAINTITAGTAFKADWSAHPDLPTGFTYQLGDSVIVEADFMVDGNQPATFQGARVEGPGFTSDAPVVAVLSQFVYASQTANPPAGPANGPDRFTCFIPKYNANVIGMWHFVLYDGVTSTGATGCNDFNIFSSVYTRKLGTYYGGRYFSYEYRPENIPDSVVLDIPAGWDYVGQIASQLNYTTAPTQNANLPLSALISPVQSSYMGGTRLVYDLKTPLENGTIPHWGSEGLQWTISSKIKAGCSTPASSTIRVTEYSHWAGYPSTSNPLHFSGYDTKPLNYNLSSRPVIALQNNTGEVQGTLPQHFWDVQVNSTGSTNAPYVWMALEQGASGISIDSVVLKPSNVVLSAATYDGTKKWYQVNAVGIASGSSQQARVYFKYNSCEADSIKLLTGWNCSGFPSPDPTASSCSEISTYLKVLPQPSQIQLSVTKQPLAPSVALCAQDNVEAVVNSALGANVDNPSVTVVAPAGMTITTPIEVEYPLGSGTWQNVMPTVSGSNYTVNLENHTGIGANGLPGTIINPGATGRQAKIRVTYNTSCDFISGSKIGFVTNGAKPCGGNVTGDGSFATTNPINITDATPAGTAGLTMSIANPVLTCSTPENMMLEIIPVGSPSAAGDTAVYTLPIGLTYTGTFAPGTNCSGCTITPVSSGGSTILKVAIPSGVAAGTTIAFSIGIQASGNGDGCGEKTILAELRRTGAILTCGGNACPKPSTAVVGNASQVITIQKPQLDASSFTFTQTGATVNYSLNITNSGTATATAGYVVKIYCGSPTGGVVLHTFNTTTLAIGASTAFTGTFSGAGCATGSVLSARIEDTMADATTPACNCSTPALATAANPLPVKLTSFTATKEGLAAQLRWATTAETNADRFEIERKSAEQNWTITGNVKAKGESNVTENYTFKDNETQNGENLYRLKMIDRDGSYAYSRIVSLSFELDGAVNLYPSPVSDVLNIKLKDWNQVGNIEMYDSKGRLVQNIHRKTSGASLTQQINVRNFTPGIYVVKIIKQNGESTTRKILIVK